MNTFSSPGTHNNSARSSNGRERSVQSSVATKAPVRNRVADVSPLGSPAADIDSLTGLGNQIGLRKAIWDLLRTAAPNAALLYVDLNRSERIYHSLGSQQRDALLVKVAQVLQDATRASDYVARLSDDTFAVCLTIVDAPDHARTIAHRIYDQFQEPILLRERSVYTPVRIGLVPDLASYDGVETVLRDADTARYEATKTHHRPVVVYDDALTRRADAQLSMEAALRNGVDRKEFVPFFQPLVSLTDGTVHGFEILARWRHPEKGLLSPGAFLDAAEETGLIIPIGHQVIHKACAIVDLTRPHKTDPGSLSLTANFSRKEFFQSNTYDFLSALFETYELAPGNFTMEISERAVAPVSEEDLSPIHALKDLGVDIFLDDFGTGLSSIQSLRHLPIDGFKIDKSLLSSAGASPWDPDLVDLIVQMGHTLDQTVTVEGIERVDQLHALRDMGCAYGQGYLFGHPVPASEVTSVLSAPFQSRFWPPTQCAP